MPSSVHSSSQPVRSHEARGEGGDILGAAGASVLAAAGREHNVLDRLRHGAAGREGGRREEAGEADAFQGLSRGDGPGALTLSFLEDVERPSEPRLL